MYIIIVILGFSGRQEDNQKQYVCDWDSLFFLLRCLENAHDVKHYIVRQANYGFALDHVSLGKKEFLTKLVTEYPIE